LRGLLGLHLFDLILDRGKKLLPLRELRLDGCLACLALGDDLLLALPCPRERCLAPFDLRAERSDLGDDPGILGGDAVRRVQPIDELVEARRPEEHLDQRVLARRVELDEPLLEVRLRSPEVRAGDTKALGVDPLPFDDRVELDLRGVVGVDGVVELGVNLLDLGEDLSGLAFLRPYGGGGRRGIRERPGR
jgi:hypothetical protein